MASVRTLRGGIQTRLATISGLGAYDVETGNELGPCAIVFPKPPASGWHQTANSGCRESHEFVVEIHVPLSMGLDAAQDLMDDLISPSGAKSVAAAVAADPTLGGAADNAIARAFTIYAFSKLQEVRTLMAMVPVEVTA